jgi:hypothetical protein
VLFSLDSLMTADVNTDSIYISPAVKEELKKDKDPEQSEQMMKFFFDMILKKMKETEEEYLDNGVYKEINTRTGKAITGSYTFNPQKNILTKKYELSGKTHEIQVSWQNGQLILSSDLKSPNGKEGKLQVVYKKL